MVIPIEKKIREHKLHWFDYVKIYALYVIKKYTMSFSVICLKDNKKRYEKFGINKIAHHSAIRL